MLIKGKQKRKSEYLKYLREKNVAFIEDHCDRCGEPATREITNRKTHTFYGKCDKCLNGKDKRRPWNSVG